MTLCGRSTPTSVREDDGKEGRRSSTLPMSFRRVRPTFCERGGRVTLTSCFWRKPCFPGEEPSWDGTCPPRLPGTKIPPTLCTKGSLFGKGNCWADKEAQGHPLPPRARVSSLHSPCPRLSPSPPPRSPRGAADRAHS